jgi:thymidylate kinase
MTLINKNLPWILGDHVPVVWKISSAPFYIKNIMMLVPMLVRMLRNGGRLLTRRELAFMAILNGWHEILQKKINHTNKIILLDQGPISIIAYLTVWGPKSLFKSNMNGWWETVYEKLRRTLDMVIWLDTSDETIIWRINNRKQNHHLKGESVQVSCDWLKRYRTLYEQIVSDLAINNNHRLHIVHIDSGINSVDEVVGEVLHEFSLMNGEFNQ